DILIETHVVPQVQSVAAAAFGETSPVAEYAPYLRSPQLLGDAVHLLVTGIHLPAGEHSGPKGSRILLNLNPYPSVTDFSRPYLGLGLVGGSRFRKGCLLGAGSRRKGAYGHQ